MRVSIVFVAITLAVADARAQVSITEVLNNPDGADQGREWLELYNFGPNEVCLDGWTLEDEDSDLFTFGELSLDSGGYLILVSGGVPGLGGVDASTAKAIFQAEWLGGQESPLVIGMQAVVLGNEADEIVLRDQAGSVIWSMAWSDDETPPFATFLTETNRYVVRVFGSREEPGIVRDGDDNGLHGFPGYEQNNIAADSHAWESQIGELVTLFGENFDNVLKPSVGSPLAGGYRNMPTGDLDGNGSVDVEDLALLLDQWGPCPAPCAACPADLDTDGLVGITDFLMLLALWG